MTNYKTGILVQGRISNWTKDIIKEYKENFPDSLILLSTWNEENCGGIECEVVKSDQPRFTKPYQSNVNHQKIGALAGLEKMPCNVIMKCRTDEYIHNKKIFKIFNDFCPNEKIMIPNRATIEFINYFASDRCQIARKENLLDFWNSIQYYDGSFSTIPEIYLVSNYIIRGKKDLRSWKDCMRDYYYIKSFKDDFQMEWEKEILDMERRRIRNNWHPFFAKPDQALKEIEKTFNEKKEKFSKNNKNPETIELQNQIIQLSCEIGYRTYDLKQMELENKIDKNKIEILKKEVNQLEKLKDQKIFLLSNLF